MPVSGDGNYNMIMLISNIIDHGEIATNALKRPNHKISEYSGGPKFHIYI